jgi:hypothetical protein
MADDICFGATTTHKPDGFRSVNEDKRLDVAVLVDKSRAMVTGELKAQITEIDKQSRDLGIEPDPFEASAPAPKAKKSDQEPRR